VLLVSVNNQKQQSPPSTPIIPSHNSV